MLSYDDLLKRAQKDLPQELHSGERFEIPTAKWHTQGNKTIISNFNQIADIFRRDQLHLLKFLQRELATPAEIDGPRLILGRKILSALINAKIELYARTFVLCKECGKPDTKITKEDGFNFIKCTACGAKNPIKSRI
nr:translation initiation factor IF-2 subunit beta [Candidatus Woesearchaeota archaeon]